MEWISVRDRMPESGVDRCIVYSPTQNVQFAERDDSPTGWVLQDMPPQVRNEEFTYWMPVPEFGSGRWMSVEKRLPDPNKYKCLVYNPNHGVRIARNGATYNSITSTVSGWVIEGIIPPEERSIFTHWTPLPYHPEEELKWSIYIFFAMF